MSVEIKMPIIESSAETKFPVNSARIKPMPFAMSNMNPTIKKNLSIKLIFPL